MLDLRVGIGAKFDRTEIVTAREFRGRRASFQVKNSQIVVGVAIVRIDFDRPSKLHLCSVDPASAADDDPGIIATMGISRIIGQLAREGLR